MFVFDPAQQKMQGCVLPGVVLFFGSGDCFNRCSIFWVNLVICYWLLKKKSGMEKYKIGSVMDLTLRGRLVMRTPVLLLDKDVMRRVCF